MGRHTVPSLGGADIGSTDVWANGFYSVDTLGGKGFTTNEPLGGTR